MLLLSLPGECGELTSLSPTAIGGRHRIVTSHVWRQPASMPEGEDIDAARVGDYTIVEVVFGPLEQETAYASASLILWPSFRVPRKELACGTHFLSKQRACSRTVDSPPGERDRVFATRPGQEENAEAIQSRGRGSSPRISATSSAIRSASDIASSASTSVLPRSDSRRRSSNSRRAAAESLREFHRVAPERFADDGFRFIARTIAPGHGDGRGRPRPCCAGADGSRGPLRRSKGARGE